MLSPYCCNFFISWKMKNCLLRDFNKKKKKEYAIQFYYLTNTKTNVEGYRMKICPRFYARTKAPIKKSQIESARLSAMRKENVLHPLRHLHDVCSMTDTVDLFALVLALACRLVFSIKPPGRFPCRLSVASPTARHVQMRFWKASQPVCGTTCDEFFGQLVCILFYAV